MEEKILKIQKMENHKPIEDHWSTFDGVFITTDKQVIEAGVSNEDQCCEHWGYMFTNDQVSDFVGAYLKEVQIVDTVLNKTKWDSEFPYGLEGGDEDAMFIHFKTDKGILEFVLYNNHNGYYGHSAYLKSNQLNKETYL